MKIHGINPDSTQRVAFDDRLRTAIKAALVSEEVSVEELVYLLVRLAIETDAKLGQGFVLGSVIGAYASQTGMSFEDVIQLVETIKEKQGHG